MTKTIYPADRPYRWTADVSPSVYELAIQNHCNRSVLRGDFDDDSHWKAFKKARDKQRAPAWKWRWNHD